jgi:hypothetical protein
MMSIQKTFHSQARADSGSSDRSRNLALDYLRVLALVLMTLVHMWRPFLGWEGVDGILRSVGETAPLLFFVSFGMTQTRLLAHPLSVQLQRLWWLGLVAVLHSYFMWFSLCWEFFLFLWSASLLVIVGTVAGLAPRHFAMLGVVVLALNSIVPLGPGGALAQPPPRAIWLIPGPFFPLPWAALVFFGLVLGTQFPSRLLRPLPLLALVAIVVLAYFKVYLVAPVEPLGLRFTVEKVAATSAYLTLGTAGTIVVYLLLGWLVRAGVFRRLIHPPVRFVSDHLLVATVLHNLSLRLLMDSRFHWPMAVNGLRTASAGELLLLSVANVVVLFVMLAVVSWLWRGFASGCGNIVDSLRLPWVTLVSITALAVMRPRMGAIGVFSFRWTVFAWMLVVALLAEHQRARPALQTPRPQGMPS